MKLKTIFHKFSSFRALLLGEDEASPVRELLYQLRIDDSDEDALQAWRDHRWLVELAEFHIEVRKLKEEIPSEYIGVVTYLIGGKLECQRYLKPLKGYGGRTEISFCEMPSTTRIGLPSDG